MTLRGLAGLGLGAIAALLLTAPNAAALTKVTAEGVEVEEFAYKGTARCKEGQRVVSGGFRTNPQEYAVVNKAKGKRSWTVKALDATELTVFAYCSSRLDASAEAKTVVAGAGARATARARCARGQQPVAGGWRLSPSNYADGNNSPVYTSRRKGGRRWVVKAFVDHFKGEDERLTAFAYCLGDDVAVKARSRRSDPLDDGENGQAKARCKPGEELLGGGFATTPRSDFSNIDGPDLFYYRAFRSGPRTWLAAAHNYGQPGTITALATCRA